MFIHTKMNEFLAQNRYSKEIEHRHPQERYSRVSVTVTVQGTVILCHRRP